MFKSSIRTRILIVFLLVAMIPLVFLGYSGYANSKKYIIEKEEEKINFFMNNIRAKMVKFFCNTKRDVLFLKKSTQEKVSYAQKDIEGRHKKELENTYYYFSQNNMQYDQIRFVNKEGYELIRVNNNKGKAYKVPNEKLQYKGKRYYFKDALNLKPGEIYISPIDLNYENGEIEKPLKPMIRYITPVYTNDELRGYLILNLNLNYLIKDIEKIGEANKYENIILLDNDGYYLHHPNEEKEWGSKNDLNTGENFNLDYPDISEEIFTAKKLKIEYSGDSILAWYPVKFECLYNRKITMFMEIEKDYYLHPLIVFKNLFMYQVIITIAALIIGGILISFYLTKPILKIVKAVENIGEGNFDVELDINTRDELELLGYEIKKMSYELKDMYKNMEDLVDERTSELQIAHKELKEMATKDSLTELYNRHYFNEFIQNVAKDVKNKHKSMMILMIDVDKFKYINDNYGHNVGDIVLKVVAQFLKKSVKKNDLAVRYGGDEFLVALRDSKIEAAETYIEEVKKNLDIWNNKNNLLKHELTLSIGYDIYSKDKDILEVISNADKMMYENKMAKKE